MILLCLFCLLFGFSSGSIVYHQDPYEKQVIDNSVVVASQDKQYNSWYFNEFDVYTFADLCSTDALYNYINWILQYDGVDILGSNSGYTRGFYVSGNAYFVQSQGLTYSNIDTNTTRYMTVQQMTLSSRGRVNFSDNTGWSNRFYLDFVSTTDTDRMFRIAFFYIQSVTLGNHSWFTEGIYYYDDNGDLAGYRSDLSLVVEYQQNGMEYTRAFLPHNLNVTNDYYSGYNTGYNVGYDTGVTDGYSQGYDAGYTDADGNFNMDPQMLTIFTGILNIGLLPVNVFLTILNFEVFGINIAGFVTSLITIAIVIIIVRFIFGGKNND